MGDKKELVMDGDREELVCPECGAPQNELDETDDTGLNFECSSCDIVFEIKNTYKIVDIWR